MNENIESTKQPINEVLPFITAGLALLPWFGTVTGALTTTGLAAAGTWLYNVKGGGDAFSKTQTFFAGCSSLDKNLKPTQSKGDHREAADSIYNAIEGMGTNTNAIKGAISSMESVADLCAMYKYYNKTYGDLYEDLDSDIDGEDFRKYVWSAIAPIVDDAEEDLAKVKKEEGGGGGGGGSKTGGSKTGGYTPCTGTYQKGCKSDIIAKVQGCLGLVTDGKFGPKTQAALSSKGFTTFTDADVTKICSTTITTTPKDEFDTQVDADSVDDVLNN